MLGIFCGQIGQWLGASLLSTSLYGADIVALAGQSNEVGFSDIDNVSNINKYVSNQYNAVRLRQQDGTNANPPVWIFHPVEGVKPRTTHATLNMGPELTLARYLNKRYTDRWGLSKIGIGDTGLNDHWKKSALYPSTPPNLFAQMIAAHRAAEAELGGRVRVFVFVQGERDANDAADAAAYEANLAQFIADVRYEFGADLPIILIKLHSNNPGAHKNTVRAAQIAVASTVPGVTLIDVDALALRPDNLHFTADSYLALGNMIGTAVLNALGLSPLHASFVATYKGRTIDVLDTSTSDGGAITSWDWDWGDGYPHSTTQNASHTYSSDYQHTITLTVTNDAGAVKTFSRAVRPVLPTWTVDPTSNKGAPANTTEWQALIAKHQLKLSVPSHLYLCQDTTGLADAIGSKHLTAIGAPGQHQEVTGWSRVAVGPTGAASTQTFSNPTMSNINTDSVMAMPYMTYNSSAGIRQLLSHGAASTNAMESPAGTRKMRLRTGASAGESTLEHADEVLPFTLLRNAATQENVLVSPKELIRIPWAPASGAELRLTVGIAANPAAQARALYIPHWEGPAAEVAVQDILDAYWALGWTITLPMD